MDTLKTKLEKFKYKKEMNPLLTYVAIFFVLMSLILLFAGCGDSRTPHQINPKNPPGFEDANYNQYYDSLLSSMKSPVVLIGKDIGAFDMCGVTLKDSTGRIQTFGNLLPIANNIGASHNIGDTIK